jgi:hypothetical protein
LGRVGIRGRMSNDERAGSRIGSTAVGIAVDARVWPAETLDGRSPHCGLGAGLLSGVESSRVVLYGSDRTFGIRSHAFCIN